MPAALRAIIQARAILLSLVLLFSIVAFQAFDSDQPSEYLPHPHVYGLLAAVAAGAAFVTFFAPQVKGGKWRVRLLAGPGWQALAGGSIVVACWIRAAAIAWAAIDAPLPDERQTGRWIGTTLWAVTGELVLAVWLAIVIPWAVRSRTRQG